MLVSDLVLTPVTLGRRYTPQQLPGQTARMRTWWLDELEHAGPEHLDDDIIAGYDAKQQFDPGPDVTLLAGLGLGPGSRLLDLGAGTGTFTASSAATGADVTAVDLSPPMIARLTERCASMPNVEAVRAGFLSFEPSGESFDVVYCRNALHQVPDFWKVFVLRRIATWLAPRGVLMIRDLVYDMSPDEVEPAFDAWFDAAVDDPDIGYTADDLANHARTEHSTFTWLLEPMLERTGFTITERTVRAGVYASYLCRRV